MMDELKTLNLGKMGLKENFLAEVKAILNKHRKIKIKVMKSALEGRKTDDLAREVSAKTNSNLVDVRGHTFILEKK